MTEKQKQRCLGKWNRKAEIMSRKLTGKYGQYYTCEKAMLPLIHEAIMDIEKLIKTNQ